MKKVLLLGGSYFQIPSVTTAKRLGYYTITCDYLPDNPGHKYADEYYNVSTTDKEAVLNLAKKLKVDGVVCKFPVMVKPTDSSGSKGVKKIERPEDLTAAVDDALKYSRCKRFIIEEYVEKYGYQIAGDGFSVDGKLKFRCFANEHFDSAGLNPNVPTGESFPYNMPARVHQKVHDEIQKLLTLLKMQTQAYNFDIRIDKDENVYLMEVGPRSGGNLIPQAIKYATGVDLVEYVIKAATGGGYGVSRPSTSRAERFLVNLRRPQSKSRRYQKNSR